MSMSPGAAIPDATTRVPFQLAPGFTAAATSCGLKDSGTLDLALVVAERPCAAAGVFTTNRVKAAPVLYDQEVLARSAGSIRAAIANSGCANACTGERGMSDTRRMAELTAAGLGCSADQVLVLSTGVIGRPLDLAKIEPGIRAVTANHGPSHAAAAARAIMTTDTRPKTAGCEAEIAPGVSIAIRGFAKGAGMIHPHMATMLSVITTDARIDPQPLAAALRQAVGKSFNRVSVDGDMSTNDTVLLLASGAGTTVEAGTLPAFTAALTGVCASLARQIARDGEGATRLVAITVSGARGETEAHAVANAIACSPLVKTAIHGGDPNWGRVLAAAGACGVDLDPGRLALAFGPAGSEVRLVERGLPLLFDAAAASGILKSDPVEIRLDLGLGAESATVWTCDLSAEYVAVNAHYTT